MQLDMTKGKPLPVILQFTIPLVIGNIFQQLYNMADTIIVPIPGHEKILSVKMAPVKALAN